MSTAVAERSANPIVVLNDQIGSREEQFKAALPAHIPVERFKRVLLTAVQNNPGLMKLDRQSFFNAAMRAAQDGLLPDGREGAIVEFAGKAQWMPMIGGLRKKVRNSGEIATWEAHVVFENDDFLYELGDEPLLRHKPTMGERGKPIAAYSIAVLRSGEKSREVMTVAQIEKVRNVSRAKNNGPWKDWWEEMTRKTVARRHAKVLPMSTDLDDLIRRDDELYDFEAAREEQRERPRPRLATMLDQIAQKPESEEGGKEIDPPAEPDVPEVQANDGANDDPPAIDANDPDFKAGAEAKRAGQKRCVVTAIREDEGRFAKWRAGYDSVGDGFPGDEALERMGVGA